MLIKEIMNTNVKTLTFEQSLKEAANFFVSNNIDGAPIIDNKGNLVGMVTKQHLLKAFVNNYLPETCLKKIMSVKFKTIFEEARVVSVWNMAEERYPVVDKMGNLVGIVTKTDLIRTLYDYAEKISGELTTILDSARNAIIAVNNKGIITIFNRAASEIIGIEIEKAIGRYVEEVLPGTGLIEVINTGSSQIAKKLRIGSTLAISNRSPLIRDGKIIGAVGIFQDISDLESISEELEYTKCLNKELDTIIEAVSDGLYITNGQGYTTRVNSTYEYISGIKKEEVLGRHMQELVDHGYYSDSVTLHVLKERRAVTITHKIKTGIEVMITGSPVFDNQGNIIMVVTTVRDMETLARMKKELQETKKLTTRYYNELEQLRLQQLELDDLVIQSAKMREIIELSIRLGKFNSTVLITGESGVGKEIVVKVIHKAGQLEKNKGSLIKVNCGAIPENLMESELFGYEVGAFTGAKKDGKPGLFELAEDGTLFLDEIGELPLNVQVKLLRAIQEREFIRLGGSRTIKINTRIIAATNKDLKKLIKEGRFREDLYYRLNVVPIYVPPLRERKADIVPLVIHFLQKYNKSFKTNKKISLELLDFFENYSWPGNVRQLENTIERLVVMELDDLISLNHLPHEFRDGQDLSEEIFQQRTSLKKTLEKMEKMIILQKLQSVRTTRELADKLGISQPTVVRKMKKYNLQIKK